MKSEKTDASAQRKFDFSPPHPRPFLTNLPARIDSYEEGIAQLFQWRTGLDYYASIDHIVNFVINTRRLKVVDLLTDTGTFALKLIGQRTFFGRVYSFDPNITLLERAKQRARYLRIEQAVDFRHSEPNRLPIPDGFAEIAVSIFDFHRHTAEQFLAEAARIIAPEGHLILAEVLEPKSTLNRWMWGWKKLHLKYIQKNPAEALGLYYDREEIIRLLFAAGFRQVIIQGLGSPRSPHSGVFSLVAATK